MDIKDVKIKDKYWNKFKPYIINSDEFDVALGGSIILFDLDKEETTFMDIVKIVKSYNEELVENNEIDDIYMWRERLSTIDPIFFQEYAKEHHGVSLNDYQQQADCGAIYYCENFISELYEKMEKDGLFSGEAKDN